MIAQPDSKEGTLREVHGTADERGGNLYVRPIYGTEASTTKGRDTAIAIDASLIGSEVPNLEHELKLKLRRTRLEREEWT